MTGKYFKIWTFAAIFVLMTCIGSFAKPVEPADARKVAENWIDYIVKNDGSWGEFKYAEAAKIEPFFVEGTLAGFVIDVTPIGFVLVPADDELPPVKAFSTDSIFNPDSYGFADWVGIELKKVTDALRSESSQKPTFMPINSELWRWLRVEYRRQESVPFVSALPAPVLTTTAWDQGDPYNRFCPEWNGVKCPVGCVATATAQVMRYWSWPPQGTGSHSYSTWSHRIQLSADFNHLYDWLNMPNSLGIGATNAQKDEVARLSSDVGIAFEMDYDPQGSGAVTTDAKAILPGYFFYSSEIAIGSYSGNDESWFNLFRTEVDAGRPALMRIAGSEGAHAIVCDGYRTDQGNLIHINMGWGGWATAYYALNNIVAGGTEFKDMYEQDIVRNIKPNEAQPVSAASAATPMGGKFPVTVSFAGQGKKGAGPYTYHWDFGDGNSADGQFPTHTYQLAGSYTVTLTAKDSAGQTGDDSHLVIKVSSGTTLSATAQASAISGRVPLSVMFTASAEGGTPSYSYTWDFGDGASQTTDVPQIQHIYTAEGTFVAVLKVKDALGSLATADGISIQVDPVLPLSAGSQASVTSGIVPLQVDFTATAQGGTQPYTYTWDFGDGASSGPASASTASHTYAIAGTYTAVLTAGDAQGQEAVAAGITIQAQPAAPVPAITSVSKLSSPFRLKVLGSNFISISKVRINGELVPSTIYKTSGKLIAGSGSALKNMCPKGVEVKITVENEEGNISVEVPFRR